MPPHIDLPALARPCLLWLALIVATHASGATNFITVGPGEAVSTVAEASRLARDGDTVLIMPGHYHGDVAVWAQNNLTIRGIGQRPIMHAAGESAEDKAIWVFRGGTFTVENIEFRGARVSSGNGAGIRFERGRLRLDRCAFHDNQMGLLTGNTAESELEIHDTLFAEAPEQYDSLPHLLYVGRIARLLVRGSRFHSGFRGHLIKSRARESDIRYNLMVDGPNGAASYELEFPDGGVARIVGNVIGQSAASGNRTVVAFGAEGAHWTENRLEMAHNTLTSEGMPPASFLRVWEDRVPQDTLILTRNNLTVGPGTLDTTAPGDHAGNLPMVFGVPGDIESLDFTISADSWLRHRLAPSPSPTEPHLRPSAEFQLPIGTRPLSPPERWIPGAFQSSIPGPL